MAQNCTQITKEIRATFQGNCLILTGSTCGYFAEFITVVAGGKSACVNEVKSEFGPGIPGKSLIFERRWPTLTG